MMERGKYYEVKSDRSDGRLLAQIEIPQKEYDLAVAALKAGQKWPSVLEQKLATMNIPPDLQYKSYTFQSGATYEGTWKGTKRHGQGKWKHPEGDEYEGQYEDNKEHGWGVYSFSGKGKKYCGQWAQGQMHGFGVYLFTSDGKERFEGYYKDDKKHGKGLYTFANGSSKFQTWNNGQLQDEHDPSRSDLEFVKDLVFDAIEQLRKVAPGHLDFLEADWIERMMKLDSDQQKKKQEADDAEKRRKEEEASKKKAEEDARKKAEDDARKKADDDARKKAEDDARKKADDEAKRKADEMEAARRAREEDERRRKQKEEEERLAKEELEAIKPKVFRHYTYAELKLPDSKLLRTEVDYTKREVCSDMLLVCSFIFLGLLLTPDASDGQGV